MAIDQYPHHTYLAFSPCMLCEKECESVKKILFVIIKRAERILLNRHSTNAAHSGGSYRTHIKFKSALSPNFTEFRSFKQKISSWGFGVLGFWGFGGFRDFRGSKGF